MHFCCQDQQNNLENLLLEYLIDHYFFEFMKKLWQVWFTEILNGLPLLSMDVRKMMRIDVISMILSCCVLATQPTTVHFLLLIHLTILCQPQSVPTECEQAHAFIVSLWVSNDPLTITPCHNTIITSWLDWYWDTF